MEQGLDLMHSMSEKEDWMSLNWRKLLIGEEAAVKSGAGYAH